MPNSATTPASGYADQSSNVVISLNSPATLTAEYTGFTLKTPSADFALAFNGRTLGFRKNNPVMCDAALLAALTAAGAPVV